MSRPFVLVQFYKDVLELGDMAKLGERSITLNIQVYQVHSLTPVNEACGE